MIENHEGTAALLKEALTSARQGTKTCTRCNEDKPLSAFRTGMRRGRMTVFPECIECKRTRDRRDTAPGTKRRTSMKVNQSQRVRLNRREFQAAKRMLACSLCGISGKQAKLLLDSEIDVNRKIDGGCALDTVHRAVAAATPYCQQCFPNRSC